MDMLPTKPTAHMPKENPTLSRPKIVGYFSLDGNSKYKGDTSQLMYLRTVPENVEFDLNKHVDKAIKKDEKKEIRLNHMLMFLLRNQDHLHLRYDNTLDSATLFCFRGLLTKISVTPYEPRQPWRIVATLYRGSIFLCSLDTPEEIARKANLTERELKCMSWGYKFEQYMLGDKPDDKPDPDEPVNEREEFNLVFTVALNKHHIIYGAEMDGICLKEGEQTINEKYGDYEGVIKQLVGKDFVELKTTRHIDNSKQDYTFRRFKLIKWWLQCYYGGVETLVCGFRDDEGVVDTVRTYSVKELPRGCRDLWDANVCLTFCSNFLTFVKRHLKNEMAKVSENYTREKLVKNLPLIALHFEHFPHVGVKVTNNYDIHSVPVLHNWFKDYFKRPPNPPEQAKTV